MTTEKEMGFLEHLEELRWRIIKSLLGIVVGAIVVFAFMDQVFQILLDPVLSLDEPPKLQVLKIHGMFLLKWGIALVGGLVVALPLVSYQIWKFVAPGLLENERRYSFPVILFSFIAFVCGVMFAYFIIIPISLNFFASMGYVDVANNFSINYYFSYILWVLVAAGLLFELPVLVMILSAIGLVTPAFMRHYRRHAIVTILLLSAFFTPPDPVSLLMMSLPLIVLYELSIGISGIFTKPI
ncbi:MAG: twin-arginine translocase subunit TatC [Candidatus Marinimicrobia bacterium]|jgi:sec-independent protein translocase protein TatC|nr:twin-arginine translocase subunit TatC [Candidatus Neomarinimicrobiota bacterium]MDP6593204.1 twin-arginine translocase subunit TatC [Candidatus Neomarinimicrobiota bacterium]MDP6835991.1 twin-arginine translocase subunit TatC [Candidatus Neomarinimicrobiota bacterium]MDP6966288.1 twin-arginine translocase subunit TatC [Candidatus Neomarinimicrobiota bacterium]|tara:strand:+ start:5200 stop:5919 length:720 start_codon:yes stop_codon:yes gene_type:complete